ncbi:MAG: hypothetical protein LBL90_07505 [Prevotellaceae bacterium]|nr:hypothetical protein [Prevotellaceae bacterium]
MKSILLIGVFAPLLISSFFTLLNYLLCAPSQTDNIINKVKETPFLLLDIILVAPLIETLVLQYLPVKLSVLHFSNKNVHCGVIILSAVIFSFLHAKSLLISVALFFTGLIWAFSCFVLIRRKSQPYLFVTSIHVGYNLVIVLFEFFVNYFFNI